MSARVHLTVDVEDWYDGMAELGVEIPRPAHCESGLIELADRVRGSGAQLTLFTVANYAPVVADELRALVADGHELASHGPDHGTLPEDYGQLVDWLRRGREELEALVGVSITGFRSPRFDVPKGLSLRRYREAIAEAGFSYVSDTSSLGAGTGTRTGAGTGTGAGAAVRELPVLIWGRVPIGGGSYQRLFPAAVTRAAVDRAGKQGERGEGADATLYYHSYDFGATLPRITEIRSVAVAKQLLARGRVQHVFDHVLRRYGSEACANA